MPKVMVPMQVYSTRIRGKKAFLDLEDSKLRFFEHKPLTLLTLDTTISF